MCNERESNVASDNTAAEPLQASDDRRAIFVPFVRLNDRS